MRESAYLPSSQSGSVKAMPSPLVEARGLTKKFDDFVAVDAIDFEIRPGEAFGFLGPNGAGKTSTMKMITTVSPITDGKMTVFGLDPREDGPEIRSRLGVVPQENNLDEELTVEENLYIYGRFHDLPKPVIRRRIEELLEFAQLVEKRDARVENLSGGMKRRLVIARALINEPDLVILDEPTTGLDPEARSEMWDEISGLKSDHGITVLLTTHYLEEADHLADHLVIVDRGVVVASGTPDELKAGLAGDTVQVELDESVNGHARTAVESVAAVHEVTVDGGTLRARVGNGAAALPSVLSALTSAGIELKSITVARPSLDDVYLRHAGRSFRAADEAGRKEAA